MCSTNLILSPEVYYIEGQQTSLSKINICIAFKTCAPILYQEE